MHKVIYSAARGKGRKPTKIRRRNKWIVESQTRTRIVISTNNIRQSI